MMIYANVFLKAAGLSGTLLQNKTMTAKQIRPLV